MTSRSLELAQAISNTTGNGALVFAGGPTLLSPNVNVLYVNTAISNTGTISLNSNISVSGNLTVNGTIDLPALTTVGLYANAAYTQANTADQRAVTSGVYANSAYLHANASYNAANNATDTWVRNAANSASSYANSAFGQANTATTNAATADQKAVTSGVYANTAFGVANTAATNALSAGSYANSAYTLANTKYNSSGGTISGDVVISGNTTISGINTIISSYTVFNSNSAIKVPTGNTAQRTAGASGEFRFNQELEQFEGYNGTAWGSIGGGASGSSGNEVFYENDANVTASYTITSGKNAMSAGPLEIQDGVIVTVPDGSVWTIV